MNSMGSGCQRDKNFRLCNTNIAFLSWNPFVERRRNLDNLPTLLSSNFISPKEAKREREREREREEERERFASFKLCLPKRSKERERERERKRDICLLQTLSLQSKQRERKIELSACQKIQMRLPFKIPIKQVRITLRASLLRGASIFSTGNHFDTEEANWRRHPIAVIHFK